MPYNFTTDDIPSDYRIYWSNSSYCASPQYSYSYPTLLLNGNTLTCYSRMGERKQNRFLVVETELDDGSFQSYVTNQLRNTSFDNSCIRRCPYREYGSNITELCLYHTTYDGFCVEDRGFKFKSQKLSYQEERKSSSDSLPYLGFLALLVPVALLVWWIVHKRRKAKAAKPESAPVQPVVESPPDEDLPPYTKSEAQVVCKPVPDV
ncbi:hypothetical protein DICA1_E12508 [Diutina catenulata]